MILCICTVTLQMEVKMDKRYQVFVSSTYTDLKEERKAIIETLLNAKYIPSGMELFNACDDEQFKYIMKIIDNSDYYVLISAGRYGSINSKSGISFTEQEYDYAVKKNIPVLVFLYDEIDHLENVDNIKMLTKFRNKVSKNRLCKMWHTKDELISSVIISLAEMVESHPQLGWNRGNVEVEKLLGRIDSLQKRNDELTKEINENKLFSEACTNLASGNDIYSICGYRGLIFSKQVKVDMTWDNIWTKIGFYLITEMESEYFDTILDELFIQGWFRSISWESKNVIKAQLLKLGLIRMFTKLNRTFVIATDYGKKYLNEILVIRKE